MSDAFRAVRLQALGNISFALALRAGLASGVRSHILLHSGCFFRSAEGRMRSWCVLLIGTGENNKPDRAHLLACRVLLVEAVFFEFVEPFVCR